MPLSVSHEPSLEQLSFPGLCRWARLLATASVREKSVHFPVFPEFQGASYLQRYDILCQRLTQGSLYTAASVIATPRSAMKSGAYAELSHLTGLKSFVSSFAGHIAAEAARS